MARYSFGDDVGDPCTCMEEVIVTLCLSGSVRDLKTAPPARTVGNRSSRIIGARLTIRGHLIGNRDDARDRNLIRCALRNEMRWRNRRSLVLLKKRVDEQPDLLRDGGVNEASCVVDSAQGGDSGDSGDSALSQALRRLLTVTNLEGALFRRVVRYL